MVVINVLIFTEHSSVTRLPKILEQEKGTNRLSLYEMRGFYGIDKDYRLLERDWNKSGGNLPTFQHKKKSIVYPEDGAKFQNIVLQVESRSCYQEHRPLTYEWIWEVVMTANTRAMLQPLQQ